MHNLNCKEVAQVSGANTLGDGLVCAGSLGLAGVSGGATAVFGGVVALGSCENFAQDLNGSSASVGDNGVQCTGTPMGIVDLSQY